MQSLLELTVTTCADDLARFTDYYDGGSVLSTESGSCICTWMDVDNKTSRRRVRRADGSDMGYNKNYIVSEALRFRLAYVGSELLLSDMTPNISAFLRVDTRHSEDSSLAVVPIVSETSTKLLIFPDDADLTKEAEAFSAAFYEALSWAISQSQNDKGIIDTPLLRHIEEHLPNMAEYALRLNIHEQNKKWNSHEHTH